MVQDPSDYLEEDSPLSKSLERSTKSLLESSYRYVGLLLTRGLSRDAEISSRRPPAPSCDEAPRTRSRAWSDGPSTRTSSRRSRTRWRRSTRRSWPKTATRRPSSTSPSAVPCCCCRPSRMRSGSPRSTSTVLHVRPHLPLADGSFRRRLGSDLDLAAKAEELLSTLEEGLQHLAQNADARALVDSDSIPALVDLVSALTMVKSFLHWLGAKPSGASASLPTSSCPLVTDAVSLALLASLQAHVAPDEPRRDGPGPDHCSRLGRHRAARDRAAGGQRDREARRHRESGGLVARLLRHLSPPG